MKTYNVIRQGQDQHVGCLVVVQDGSFASHSYDLPHVKYHSPAGLEYGYAGSGPADLALSILADHFNEDAGKLAHELRTLGRPSSPAWVYHQDFKWDVIAGKDRAKPWSINSENVQAWLDQVRARNQMRLDDTMREVGKPEPQDAQKSVATLFGKPAWNCLQCGRLTTKTDSVCRSCAGHHGEKLAWTGEELVLRAEIASLKRQVVALLEVRSLLEQHLEHPGDARIAARLDLAVERTTP